MKLFRVAVSALAFLGATASAEAKTKWTPHQSCGYGQIPSLWRAR
jgi:hypothetical protein